MGYFFSSLLLSKPATETLLDVSEVLLIACGFVLAFGCIGEYLEEHRKLPRWMAWPKLVFITMVVASLIGEFFSDAGVFLFSRHLQTISEGEFAALNKEAGDARDEAGHAMERASKADERASANEKEAGRLRLDLVAAELRLEAVRVWAAGRRISEKQHREFVRELKLYPSPRYRVSITKLADDEAGTFAEDIMRVLGEAGWGVNINARPMMVPPSYNVTGTVDDRTEAGAALLKFFQALPTSDVKGMGTALRDSKAEAVGAFIIVGTRPTIPPP
jgi:hypothetical protein